MEWLTTFLTGGLQISKNIHFQKKKDPKIENSETKHSHTYTPLMTKAHKHTPLYAHSIQKSLLQTRKITYIRKEPFKNPRKDLFSPNDGGK